MSKAQGNFDFSVHHPFKSPQPETEASNSELMRA